MSYKMSDEDKKEFNEKFVEFRADGTEYGAGLYLKQNPNTVDELKEWIEQHTAKVVREERENPKVQWSMMPGNDDNPTKIDFNVNNKKYRLFPDCYASKHYAEFDTLEEALAEYNSWT